MLPPMRADDPFLDRYAHGTRAMTASEIRALFAVASRPEVVSLAGGMPFTAALPFDVIGEVAAEVLDKEGPTALQYGGGQGDPRLREILVELMRLEGIHASGEDVVVTIGSQQALDLLARMFCDPGDVIVAEGPSYVGALSAFSQYQVEVRHAPLDDDGLDPNGLVVEDNPYGRLGFESDPPQALRAQDADNVVYLGSLSKIFCPGLRIGWALVPPSLRERMVIVKEAADLSSSNFAQAMAYRYFAEYPWRETLKELRVIYRERRDAMLEALDEEFPAGVRWTRPQGGFYIWADLGPQLDTRAMLAKAIAARVAYVPGGAFYADGQGASFLRLSYCFPSPERIREGVRRLSGVIAEELDLVRALGGVPTPDEDIDKTPPAGWGGV